MGWGISLNKQHIALWRGYLLAWAAFVGFVVLLGWHLKPRADEVAFVLALPLVVLIPYAAGCLVLAVVKALWPVRLDWQRLLGRCRLIANHRLGKNARP